jgi:hypothetical protein
MPINPKIVDKCKTPFVKMRDIVLAHATGHRLRKLGDAVWRPVDGCPCAYEYAMLFRAFLNERLHAEPMYNRTPAVQRELIVYLTNYDPSDFRDIEWDMDLFSFEDGVFLRSEERFVPNAEIVAATFDTNRVARVHIPRPFQDGGRGTPLIDKVLSDQFSPAVVEAFTVLVGRLFYNIGERDNWQVIPWVVGLSGTGKSLIMDVVTALFAKGAVGVLTSNQEQVFGLADKHDKQVLIGRDLPRHMSSVLAQELFQSMVSGEDVCVPHKNQTARVVRWATPMIFCSNHTPDYVDNAGQVARRLAMFHTKRVVAVPDTGLFDRIRRTELPAFLAKALRAYHTAVEAHAGQAFLQWCPAELRVSQCRSGKETSLVAHTTPIDVHIQQDTSSASERRFRDGLQRATGLAFKTGHRPDWLVNAATGCNLELDMFNDDLQLAIEYDGPHHYTYPNRYHTTRDEFDASCARDALKDAQCAKRGVTLLRVRAVGDIDGEVATCMAAMASRGFLDSKRPPT